MIPLKYLRFESISNPGHKTKKWDVVARIGGFHLGRISWSTGWRKYVFYPSNDTLFDASCLRDIEDFLMAETALQKEKV